jgi:aminomethyltransferase
MVPFAGYEMPVQYEGIMAEHLWTRENAGLFDVSHMGQLNVHGAGADAALETIFPGDLKNLPDMKLRYSLLLAEDGTIIDDLMATRRGDDFYVVVNGATKHGDIQTMQDRLPREIVVDHMREQALLALQGPRAVEALEHIAPGVADLGFMQGGAFRALGQVLWISRSGYTGEDGFEISIAASAAPAVADALTAHEAVKPIGLGARDSLRLEAGLCLYGHDIDTTTSPVEAAIAWSIGKRRREEGGFPGAERVQRELREGPARKRVGIKPEGRAPAREGTEIHVADDDPVGRVTSGGFGPSVNGPVAMGYVETKFAAPGTAVTLMVRGKALPARVAPMPFVPHRYVRI